MRNDDPKVLVRRKLKQLFDAIAEHASENSEFLAQLERVLAIPAAENLEATGGRSVVTKRVTGPNLLEVLHSSGEDALRHAVDAMTTDELVRLCVQEGLRKPREAKQLDRTEVMNLLLEMARNRLRQGESFIRRGD